MKYSLFALALIASVPSHAEEGPTRATLEQLNGIVAGLRCSGAFVTLGRSDSERAVVLTAGHCTGPSWFYAPGAAEAAFPIERGEESVYTYLPSVTGPENSHSVSGVSYWIHSILYGTMTTVDAGLYEVVPTIGELKALGVQFFELADSLPKPGEKLRVTSGLHGKTQECEIAEILENNDAEKGVFGTDSGQYRFRNMLLMDKNCYGEGGWSGSPVFNPETRLIYGVMSRLQNHTVPNTTTSLSMGGTFMSSRFMTEPAPAEKTEMIASNVIDLKDCLSSDGKLAINAPACTLPKPTPRQSVIVPQPKTPAKAPAKKPGSLWPAR